MRTGKRPGQTLVEVCMATIVAAMTTTAIFSVMLSGFTSQAKADKREAAAMVLKRAHETLKSYVSAAPNESAYEPTGPDGTGIWVSDLNKSWALSDGGHNITSLLNGTPLTGGTFIYTVTSMDCGFGTVNKALACKSVKFDLTYPDN